MYLIVNEAFIKVSNKRYNYFDEEMADATFIAFKNVNNQTKARFPAYFEGTWINYEKYSDIDEQEIKKTKKALVYLKNKLISLREEYTDMPFKNRYTDNFISVVNKMIAGEESLKN